MGRAQALAESRRGPFQWLWHWLGRAAPLRERGRVARGAAPATHGTPGRTPSRDGRAGAASHTHRGPTAVLDPARAIQSKGALAPDRRGTHKDSPLRLRVAGALPRQPRPAEVASARRRVRLDCHLGAIHSRPTRKPYRWREVPGKGSDGGATVRFVLFCFVGVLSSHLPVTSQASGQTGRGLKPEPRGPADSAKAPPKRGDFAVCSSP